MLTILEDVRLGARTLLKHPRQFAAPFLTLTIGLAAAATMFSVVNAVLIESLPYTDPDRLALVWDRTGDSARDIWLSPPEFADLRARARAFDDIAAMTDRRYTLTGRAEPEELQAAAVSPNLFSLLGARAAAGRMFQPGDDVHGSGFVAIIAEPLAERLFGGRTAAVGQSVTLDGQAWTIVGVAPRAFGIWPPSSVFPKRIDVWVPIDSETYTVAGRNQNNLHAIGRLRAGVTAEAASADVARVAETIVRENPEQYAGRSWRMIAVGFREHIVAASRAALLILFAAVGLLVVVACANVANMLSTRASGRLQEMAVRAALGASSGRLLRQVLTENAALGGAAAVSGLMLAAWTVAWIAHSGPADVPRLANVAIDARTLAFSACAALLATLISAAVPAWQLSRPVSVERLKEGRGMSAGFRVRRVRSVFVAAQIAVALTLTVGTGLLVKAFVGLTRAQAGFEADAIATGRVRLPLSSYPDAAARSRFFTTLTRRLAERGDLSAVGAITQLPMSGAFLGSSFTVQEGGADAARSAEFSADLRGVTPGYFETMAIRLVSGRDFSPRDGASANPVTVIDETLARRFFPSGDAVGRHLRWVRTGQVLEIVGVVKAVRHYGLAAPPRETVYRPTEQYAAVPEMFVETRSPRGFESARDALVAEVRRLDPNQPITDLRRLDSLVEESLGQPRFNTLLLLVFAGISLLLSALGVYAVLAFAVSERTREIGVRIALGANRREILQLIIGDGLRMVAAGVVVGVVAAAMLTRSLGALLAGVSPLDPQVFALVLAGLPLIALIASYIPARRAAQLDPVDALRR